MTNYTYKIHPSIGIARVGTGDDPYDAPETMGAVPTNQDGTPVTQYRDNSGKLRPQSAVFKVYRYAEGSDEGEMLESGVQWTAWLANKKAAWFEFEGPIGEIDGYPSTYPLRNDQIEGQARQALILDAGCKPIPPDGTTVKFDLDARTDLANMKPYRVQNLGYASASEQGELRIWGGGGNAGQLLESPESQPVLGGNFANNPGWFDEISDGPVTATVTVDGVTVEVDPAWVLCVPPKFGPELVNLVTLTDTIFDMLVRTQGYNEKLYKDGKFQESYRPSFEDEIKPILERPDFYRYVARLPEVATAAHAKLEIMDPTSIFDVVRPPSKPNEQLTSSQRTAMPYLAGDNPFYTQAAQKTFLTLTETQFFFLEQWSKNQFTQGKNPDQSTKNLLDEGVLQNCVGGPFVPGIEVTWICRKPQIYAAPFRIKHKKGIKPGELFYPKPNTGYTFDELFGQGVEPGDLTAFMAQPWQSDYNLCSAQGGPKSSPGFDVHLRFTLWWWATQRPDWVYRPRQDKQTTWIASNNGGSEAGISFANGLGMVERWENLGFILRQSDQFPEFVLTQEVADSTPPPSAGAS
jgi:hypothetical protein